MRLSLGQRSRRLILIDLRTIIPLGHSTGQPVRLHSDTGKRVARTLLIVTSERPSYPKKGRRWRRSRSLWL